MVEDLREQIGRGQAVVVTGAGVSVAASGSAACASWLGLLQSALARCVELGGPPAGWQEAVSALIGLGDVSGLVTAAEMLTERMGGREGGEYRRWLRERVGSLPMVDRSVLDALAGLGVPIATTNYDGLIEEATGWGTVTWMDGARIQEVLRGDERAVMHLHGWWREPESVVLGLRSYEQVLGDGAAQALKRAMGSLRSLVFVGMGAGASDPNFTALRRWLARTFPGSGYRHFRLCLASEVDTLKAEHRTAERVLPVAYGDRHDHLAVFLRSLGRAPTAPLSTPTAAVPALPGRRPTVGRDAQVAEVVANLLAGPPAATLILGAPGIGKTNLALAALHHVDVVARYGGGRVFVRCESASSAPAVVAELATALGLPLTGGDLLPACLGRLAGRPAVVCLDNAETPWEADTLATEGLFAQLVGVAGAGLVVTLRGAEQPGGASWARPLRLEPLDAADVRTQFLSIAGERFDEPGLVELLREMGGIPLAVELLAHAAEGEPGLASLAGRWRAERVRLLEKGGGDHRLLSVAVSVEASWGGPLMTRPARRLLSLLGQLPDGVAHADIEALVPGEGGGAANVLRRRALAFDEAGRLRTHPPLRHYVDIAHRPTETDWERAIVHYRGLATKLGPKVGGPSGADAARRLAAESANLTAALLSGLAEADRLPALDAAHALCDLARFTGTDLASVFAAAVPAAQAARDTGRLARAHEDLAHVAQAHSDHEGARGRYEEALRLYRQVSDVLGEANCILSLGNIALARSDHEGARGRYEEALPLYRQVGDVQGEANCIRGLGEIALRRSNHEEARTSFQKALPLYRQVGAVQGEANCIRGLGDIALQRSDLEGARARHNEALALYRQMGAVWGEAGCIQRLGEIALRHSDLEGARARYEEARPLFRQMGAVLGEAKCVRGLGEIALRHSDLEGAQARYEEALPLFRRVGSLQGEANCILGLGDMELARSGHEGARVRYEEALALYERIPEPYSIGMTLRRLARLTPDEQQRRRLVESAGSAWASIDRPDLVAELDSEFGAGTERRQRHHGPRRRRRR